MSKNKDLEAITKPSYKEIRKSSQMINPALNWRLHSRGLNQRYVKAKDIYYYDDEGNEYLDFFGCLGVNNIGHNHPRIQKLIKDFLNEDVHVFMQTSLSPGESALAKKLNQLTGLDAFFFCNSGTEATEAAMKLARKATGKKRIIYAEEGFHGKTLGSLSITARPKYQNPYKPLIPECICVPYNNPRAIEEELRKGNVAMVALEPIQGEGGINVPDKGYLKKVRALCDRYSALLYLDEIQTGLGRTGKMFAYEWEDITPDILSLAKGLSGTMIPIGALATTKKIWNKAMGSIKDSTHQTSTFGGNNLATAVALTTLKIIEDEKLAENAYMQGEYLKKELNRLKEKHPKFLKDVRGKGLLIGLEFKLPKNILSRSVGKAVTEGMLNETIVTTLLTVLLNKHKIITVFALNKTSVLRLAPPLTVKKEHVDRFVDALDKVLGSKYWGALIQGSKIMLDVQLKR